MDEQTTSSPETFDLQSAVIQVREAIEYLRTAIDRLEQTMDRPGSAQMEAHEPAAVRIDSGPDPIQQRPGLETQRAEAEADPTSASAAVEDAAAALPSSWAGVTPEQEPRLEPAAWAATTDGAVGTAASAPAPEEAAWPAEPAYPSAPDPWAQDLAGYRPPAAPEEAPGAATAEEAPAAHDAPKSTWGQWSAPPSLREGGWPAAPEQTAARSAEPVHHIAGDPQGEAGHETEEDEVRDQVRRAVEQLRAELGGSVPAAEAGSEATEVALEAEHPSAANTPDDVREQVRRAVLEARAELESGRNKVDDAPALHLEPAAPPRAGRPEAIDERMLQPAGIVIDDPEGRVELVRVYRTLSLLNCAATANLANYSSHSVTVQLDQTQLPAEGQIAEAIRQAFDRDCTVEVTMNRATIRLAGSKSRVA